MNRQRKNEITQQRIISALIVLINEKGFTNLTVSDIARVAELSRGTFYVYYLDKYDLLEKVEQNLISNLTRLMQTNIDCTISWLDHSETKKTTENLTDSPYRSFIQSFDYLDQNRTIIKSLLSQNGDSQFLYQLKTLIDKQIKEHYQLIFKDEKNVIPNDYKHDLLITSLMSIIGHWLQKESPESPTEIAEILINSRLLASYQLK